MCWIMKHTTDRPSSVPNTDRLQPPEKDPKAAQRPLPAEICRWGGGGAVVWCSHVGLLGSGAQPMRTQPEGGKISLERSRARAPYCYPACTLICRAAMLQLSEKLKWPAGEDAQRSAAHLLAVLGSTCQAAYCIPPVAHTCACRPLCLPTFPAGYWAFDGRKNMYCPFTQLVPNDELTDEVRCAAQSRGWSRMHWHCVHRRLVDRIGMLPQHRLLCCCPAATSLPL